MTFYNWKSNHWDGYKPHYCELNKATSEAELLESHTSGKYTNGGHFCDIWEPIKGSFKRSVITELKNPHCVKTCYNLEYIWLLFILTPWKRLWSCPFSHWSDTFTVSSYNSLKWLQYLPLSWNNFAAESQKCFPHIFVIWSNSCCKRQSVHSTLVRVAFLVWQTISP